MIQNVIRGRDSILKAAEMIDALGIRRPLIVGSRHLIPRLQRGETLETAPVFSGYHPNPDLADAEEGVEIYRTQECDGLISIGGGSAMDTAKAIKAWMCAESTEDLKANRLNIPADSGTAGTEGKIASPRDLKKRAGRPKGKSRIPHLAIPGTAGSGAEATATAVVYENGQKLSLSHPALLPEGVILDAGLLDSLPDYHKKSCALDALSQGIESYWARGATEDSRVHAFLAFRGVLDNLKGYLAGDPHAAEEMMDASYQSGKAIYTTRTTAAHAMSYQITKLLGPAHGHACAMTLPILWDLLVENGETHAMMADLAEKMGLGEPMMGSRLLRGILIDLEMPVPGMPNEEMLDRLASSVNTERLSNHPMTLSPAQIRAVYRRAFTPLGSNERQACLDIWKYYGT